MFDKGMNKVAGPLEITIVTLAGWQRWFLAALAVGFLSGSAAMVYSKTITPRRYAVVTLDLSKSGSKELGNSLMLALRSECMGGDCRASGVIISPDSNAGLFPYGDSLKAILKVYAPEKEQALLLANRLGPELLESAFARVEEQLRTIKSPLEAGQALNIMNVPKMLGPAVYTPKLDYPPTRFNTLFGFIAGFSIILTVWLWRCHAKGVTEGVS